MLAATPFRHKVTLGGTKLATVHQLPPTLMAQYCFDDKQKNYDIILAPGLITPLRFLGVYVWASWVIAFKDTRSREALRLPESVT